MVGSSSSTPNHPDGDALARLTTPENGLHFETENFICGVIANEEAVVKKVGTKSLVKLAAVINDCRRDVNKRNEFFEKYGTKVSARANIRGACSMAQALWTGLRYLSEEGEEPLIPVSRRDAVNLWKICAKKKCVAGIFYLGLLKEFGDTDLNIAQDERKALDHYREIQQLSDDNRWISLKLGILDFILGNDQDAMRNLENYEDAYGGQLVQKWIGDAYMTDVPENGMDEDEALRHYEIGVERGGPDTGELAAKVAMIRMNNAGADENEMRNIRNYVKGHMRYNPNHRYLECALARTYLPLHVAFWSEQLVGKAYKLLKAGATEGNVESIYQLIRIFANCKAHRNWKRLINLCAAHPDEDPVRNYELALYRIRAYMNRQDHKTADYGKALATMDYFDTQDNLIPEEETNMAFLREVVWFRIELYLRTKLRNVGRALELITEIQEQVNLGTDTAFILKACQFLAIRIDIGDANDTPRNRTQAIQRLHDEMSSNDNNGDNTSFSNKYYAKYLLLLDDYRHQMRADGARNAIDKLYDHVMERGDIYGMKFLSKEYCRYDTKFPCDFLRAMELCERVGYVLTPSSMRSRLRYLEIDPYTIPTRTGIEEDEIKLVGFVREKFGEIGDENPVEELLRIAAILIVEEDFVDVRRALRIIRSVSFMIDKHFHGCMNLSSNQYYHRGLLDRGLQLTTDDARMRTSFLNTFIFIAEQLVNSNLVVDIAIMLLEGSNGMKKNRERGIRMFEKAVENKNVRATQDYATLLMLGARGVEQDKTRAKALLGNLATHYITSVSQRAIMDLARIGIEEYDALKEEILSG